MKPGDHLIAVDSLHTHHGVYMGAGRVAQYGAEKGKRNARVEIVGLETFAAGRRVKVLDSPAAFGPDEILRRVESRLGEYAYSVVCNNCEQFVNWCRTGRHESRQVDRVMERTASVSTKIAARLAAKVFAKVVVRSGGKLAARTVMRAASPWLLIADIAQLGTEMAVSQCGTDKEQAERTAQVVGLGASVGIGAAVAGPFGLIAGAGLWFVGELAGKCLTDARRTLSPLVRRCSG